MQEIVIRKAADTDLPAIVAMQNAAFHGEQGIPEDSVEHFSQKSPVCWCAFQGETLVGTVAAWQEEGRTHVGRFVVDPNYRGHHIGRRLICTAFEDLFAEGAEELYMEARAITVKLVKSVGGRVVGETVPFFGGTITPMTLEREAYRKAVKGPGAAAGC